ncbi:MAG: hypothetical protein PF445_08055 [Melioribacteraceae bacterium]|jgi:hypothetical protein|nr:hypothetical protein [Melioribacteraceae bacterium]
MIDIEKDNVYKGIPAAPGIRISKAFLFKKEIEIVKEESKTDV